jgi:hypothetical protein
MLGPVVSRAIVLGIAANADGELSPEGNKVVCQ